MSWFLDFLIRSLCGLIVALNVLTVGQTTSGKSTAKCRDIVLEALRGLTSIVVCDPHKNSLARWICTHLLARGLERRVLFDQLSYLKKVLGWCWLEPSKAKDELTRRAENDERKRALGALLGWQRGTQQLGPQTQECVDLAVEFYIAQDEETDIRELHNVLVPGHPILKKMLDHCTDPDLTRWFGDLARRKIARGVVAPAYRLISGVTRCPSFQLRSVRSIDAFSLEAFLGNPDNPGILLIEGGSDGNVSFESMRVMLGAVIQKVVSFVKNRPHPEPRIHLVIDEGAAAGLVDRYLSRVLMETQKGGLNVTILTQTPNFGNPFVNDSVMQNTQRHEWMFCGSAAVAQQGAADLGSPDYKERLMRIGRGVRIVKDLREVFQEYVPPMERAWSFPGLDEAKAKEALRRIRKRPEYLTGARSTAASERSVPSTLSPPATSFPSSPADRLRAEGLGE